MSDITASRHRGNPESVAANKRIGTWKKEACRTIYHCLIRGGPCTSKELNFILGMAYTTVSARLSELKADGWVVKTGKRREGAAEVRAVTAEERDAKQNSQLDLALPTAAPRNDYPA